jgi:hypothetical protein
MVSAVIVVLGFFSNRPADRLRADTDAIVTLSFSHAGRNRQECRRFSPEETAKLQPNMRQIGGDCPRGRWPVYVQLELDGRVVYAGTRQPAGLWKDGPSTLFARFQVPAGVQRAQVALRDSGRDSGFDASAGAELDLAPGQNLVIEFKQPGGFTFK